MSSNSGTTQIDWKNSPAHLNLLARFIEPRLANDTTKFQQWTTPLGEPAEIAIKRFLGLGLIERADLVQHLLAGFNGSQLKQMLTHRGLPVSGTKLMMAKRLVENDEQGAKQAVEGLFVLTCSDDGKKLADAYLQYESLRRNNAIKQSETALQESRYRDAALIVAKYESDSVFPRGMSFSTSGEGSYWSHYNPARDEAMLGHIFTRTPKLFVSKGWDKLPDVRLIAGMSHLWGNAGNAQIECSAEIQAAASALDSHAYFLVEMDDCRRQGYECVQVLTCNDSTVCEPCRRLAKTKHRLDDMPELPYEHCKEELGCRCWIIAAIDR